MNKYHLGPLVRQIRRALGIGATAFSEQIGTNTGNLSRFERGRKGGTHFPDSLYPIAEALGTNVPALFLLQEICWSDPSILNNPATLLHRLSRMTHEIGRLVSRPSYSSGSVQINSHTPTPRNG